MGVTVEEAMSIGGLNKSKVICGKSGLHNIIEHVSVIEIPEAHHWFRGKELFLTAFYNVRNDLNAQLKLLEEMKNKGVSALGVCYPGRYYQKFHPKFIALADTLEIPIIEIPDDVAYIDIISPITERIHTHPRYKKKAEVVRKQTLIENWIVHNRMSTNDVRTLAQEINWDIESIVGVALLKSSDNKMIKEVFNEHFTALDWFETRDCRGFFIRDHFLGSLPVSDFISHVIECINQSAVSEQTRLVYHIDQKKFIDTASHSYNNLIKLLLLQAKIPNMPKVTSADRFPILELFTRENQDYNPFLALIKPIEVYDAQHDTDLYKTFKHVLFIEDMQSICRSLNIHRNTLTYRRQKISEILCDNPFRRSNTLQYQFAVYCKYLYHEPTVQMNNT